FRKGYVDTLQATIVIPYPGTPLYNYCLKNNLLNFTDYERFDQREQVMKSDLTSEEVKKMTQDLYKSFLSPIFILKKIISIRSLAQLKFLYNAGIKVLAHLNDFK
ncbi:MAG: B12-binding domain-containing radical SAM protein, partial [Candidatus Parcubacteria bacterium]|nr:B12-binding domain-containing radical SAM protein [Candidatus Parcubacteria bacterium]